MTPLSLQASGVLGIAVVLGNPSSTPILLSQFDTGQSLPSFQLSTLQGATIHLNALEGRVLILNFWDTWC